ncbi:MAG TPA: VOC family protein [Verrucomicrobiae bacterium]|nr:VOC family protein [Verrucomicrobiae bacterium]
MFSRIAHVAIYTESYQKMAHFYKAIFGMKQITSGMRDESGQARSDLGHVSDGTIGLALLKRNAGIRSGLDHFGFDVKDIKTVLDRISKSFPEILVKSDLGDIVPFVSVRVKDPVGTHIDLSQADAPNVREGYAEERWEQPRHFNHVALRAIDPARLAEFYKEVFELQEVETAKDNVCLSDGKNYLVIRPCHTSSYVTMNEGLDHIGFKVESLAKAKSDLADIGISTPQSAPKKIAGGRFGDVTLENLEACAAGKYGTADPDGVLLHLSE